MTCVVSIHGRGRNLVGTGIIVAEDLVLTCAHVVNGALGRPCREQRRPTNNDELEVRFAGAPKALLCAAIDADPDAWSEPPADRAKGADLCLLKLRGQLPEGASVGQLTPIPFEPEIDAHVSGYPANWNDLRSTWCRWRRRRTPQLDVATAKVMAVDGFLWLLRADQASWTIATWTGRRAAGLIHRGFSGGPLEFRGGVIGLVASARAEIREGTAYAIPTLNFPARIRPHIQPPSSKLPRVEIARLPITRGDLFGREDELKRLDAAWGNPYLNVMSVVAWGGVGKSALIRHWVDTRARNFSDVDRIYAWSFFSQGTTDKTISADLFIESALGSFGDRDPKNGLPWNKGERLANLIRAQKTLLILDGLEPLQYPPTDLESRQGRLKDHGLRALIGELAERNSGLCVITTRLKVTDLARSGAEVMELEHLQPNAGAELLRSLLTADNADDELKAAANEFGGHALALTLLGSYLEDACDGDVRRRAELGRLQQDEQHGGHARLVMDSYENWLGDGPAVAILYLLGLFDRPAEGDVLRALRAEPPIPELTEVLQDISDIQWDQQLAVLRRARLLGERDRNEPDKVDAHPLVREHFAEKLRRKSHSAWAEGHKRLYEYFEHIAPHEPKKIEEMTTVLEAIFHACESGRHREALKLYQDRILQGDKFFSTYRLYAFGSEMAVLYHFFDPPWTRPVATLNEAEKAFVLKQAGYCQRAVGILRESAKWLEKALEAYTSLGNKLEGMYVYELMSGLYLDLGELDRAQRCAEASVQRADDLGKDYNCWVNRTRVGEVLHNFGRYDEAACTFVEAEGIMQRTEHSNWYIYGVSGFRYLDLLLTEAAYQEVQRRANWMLAWVDENPDHPSAGPLTIALSHLYLGYAHMLEAQRKGVSELAEAEGHFDQAINDLQQTDRQDFVVRGLLGRGQLNRSRRNLQKAEVDLKNAISIANRSGMDLRLADCRLAYAQLLITSGRNDEASNELSEAANMVKKMAYHRRDQELEELCRQS